MKTEKKICNKQKQDGWWLHICGLYKGHKGQHRCKYPRCIGFESYRWGSNGF